MISRSQLTATVPAVAPVVPNRSRYRPLGLDEVAITGGFWHERQEVNARSTLTHIEHWLEREGWLRNFDLVAAGDVAGRRGREFSDSEVYKLLEAIAWELGRRPDGEQEARFGKIVARIGAAQDDDGYIGTRFGHDGQQPRYSDLEWGHELYCMGHLIQAAVARARTGRPEDELVQIACRAADHICDTFGSTGIHKVCGHAEIEMALAELGRVTGEQRYLAQAEVFISRRGTGTLAEIGWGRSYYQDDVPVRDAVLFRGHAVRANYLAAGAVDVAVDSGDEQLLTAIEGQWRNTRARRTYITGGQGSRHQDEAFGDDFMLPPDRAYSETCAAIASNMVSWRLLLASGAPEYGDAIERTLYNVVATSPDDDGRAFYYANTLHQRVADQPPDPHVASQGVECSLRTPWFEVSCCPPNLARTFATLDTVVATADEHGIQIHQYAPARIDTVVAGLGRIRLQIETDFPADGRIVVRVLDAPRAGWQLGLRVPEWATGGATICVDGQEPQHLSPGAAAIEAPGAGADAVLTFDMTPRFVWADPRVDSVRGCVAVERGPEVWCLESVDLPAASGATDISQVRVDTSVPPRYENGRVVVRAVIVDDADEPWPYASRPAPQPETVSETDIALVRYHGWARRGPSAMRVWIPHV